MTDSPQNDSSAVEIDAPRAPWAAPEQPSQEPAAPRKGAAVVGHFLRWSLLAVAAVLLISIALQLVVTVIGVVIVVIRDGSASDSDIASGDQLAIMIASQLASIAVFAPWWKRVRRQGLGIARGDGESARSWGGEGAKGLMLALFGIALIGIALQVLISLALNIILPLFPDVLSEYNDLMETGGTQEFAFFPVLSVAVLAPISEELTVRGVALQFALRGVCPAWDKRLESGACAQISVGPLRFWVANTIQALAFGILHLNITQGIYAFVLGMMLGWMFGRTGKLRYGIALHLAVNFSSYFVEGLFSVFGILGGWGVIIAPIACLIVGLRLFMRAIPASPESALAHAEPSNVPAEPALK